LISAHQNDLKTQKKINFMQKKNKKKLREHGLHGVPKQCLKSLQNMYINSCIFKCLVKHGYIASLGIIFQLVVIV
jgi:hypothetical protein